MPKYKHFICKKEEGCRLTDLDLPLSKNQKFKREVGIVEKSKSIKAAINAGWIKEIDPNSKTKKSVKKKSAKNKNTSKE